jgi:hypothetical protein
MSLTELPPNKTRIIEYREKFPGLVLNYVVGALDPKCLAGSLYKEGEHVRRTYEALLAGVQFVYPQPEDPTAKHGTCAHAWFADRGDWLYTLEETQRNSLVPAAFPEWLRSLGRQVHAGSKKTMSAANAWGADLISHGWNCCLVSYGTSSAWTFGEDPWHPEGACVSDLFISGGGGGGGAQDISLVLCNPDGVGVSVQPLLGSILTWRGKGWTMGAKSKEPFYRLSFRFIHPNLDGMQKDAKYPHRLRDALRQEKRIIPLHLNIEEHDDVLQGRRPHSPVTVLKPKVAQVKAKEPEPEPEAVPSAAKKAKRAPPQKKT